MSSDEPTPRNFTEGSWQATITDEEILSVVRDGKGAMPAFGGALSDTEIVAALESVRSFSE